MESQDQAKVYGSDFNQGSAATVQGFYQKLHKCYKRQQYLQYTKTFYRRYCLSLSSGHFLTYKLLKGSFFKRNQHVEGRRSKDLKNSYYTLFLRIEFIIILQILLISLHTAFSKPIMLCHNCQKPRYRISSKCFPPE